MDEDTYTKWQCVIILISSVMLWGTLIYAETVQPQQFRYQTPPPALDIRPSYETTTPCKG